MCCGKRFPIQAEHKPGGRPATTIDWHEAEKVYDDYAYVYGFSQSLERLAQRGGFGHDELTIYPEEAAAKRARLGARTTGA